LPDRELARYADISARTLARRKKEGKLQALLYNDVVVFNDMLTLLRYLYEQNQQLSSLVSEAEMKPVIEGWGEVFRADNGS
jgi:hypothetical protein